MCAELRCVRAALRPARRAGGACLLTRPSAPSPSPPCATQAPAKWAHLYSNSGGTAAGAAAGARDEQLCAVLEAFPRRPADAVAKVLAASDWSTQRAADTLMDPAATRAALGEWGRADKRGRTPNKQRVAARPAAEEPPAAQQQQLQAQQAQQTPRARPEVYRRGEAALPPPPASRFTDADARAGQPVEFMRMMRTSQAIERDMLAKAAAQPVYSSPAVGLSSVEQELERYREKQEALAAELAYLQAQTERKLQERSAMLAAQALEAAMKAEGDMHRAAAEGAAAADNALMAALAAIGARCEALHAAVYARQKELQRAVTEAHAATRRAVARAADAAAPAAETLRAARAATAPVDDEPLRAAAATLREVAQQIGALLGSGGAPPFAVTFAPEADDAPAQLVALLTSFGAVSVAAKLEPAPPAAAAEAKSHGCNGDGGAKPAPRLTAAAVVAAGSAKEASRKAPPLPRGGFSTEGFRALLDQAAATATAAPVDDAPAPRGDDEAVFPPLPGRVPPPRPRAGSSSPPSSGGESVDADASSEASSSGNDNLF